MANYKRDSYKSKLYGVINRPYVALKGVVSRKDLHSEILDRLNSEASPEFVKKVLSIYDEVVLDNLVLYNKVEVMSNVVLTLDYTNSKRAQAKVVIGDISSATIPVFKLRFLMSKRLRETIFNKIRKFFALGIIDERNLKNQTYDKRLPYSMIKAEKEAEQLLKEMEH